MRLQRVQEGVLETSRKLRTPVGPIVGGNEMGADLNGIGLHHIIGCEEYELAAARAANGPGNVALRAEVKAVLAKASLKTIASNGGGSRILIRIKAPALGPNRVVECSLVSYRHTVVNASLILKSLCEGFSYQAYVRDQKRSKSEVCSVNHMHRDSRWSFMSHGPARRRYLSGVYTPVRENIWNQVLEELGSSTLELGFNPIPGIVVNEITAMAVALESIGAMDLVHEIVAACKSTTVHLDASKKRLVAKCLDRTRTEIRCLLNLGIDHEAVKEMLDEEVVRLIQEV